MVVDPERTRQEMILAAADGAGDQVWLQGSVIDTMPERAIAGGHDDAVGELLDELDEILGSDTAVLDLTRTLSAVADALPVAALEQFNPKDPAVVHELLTEVRRTLPSALTQELD